MAEIGRATTSQVAFLSRRALLASSLVLPLLLAACGDESDTREFAGGPQTPGPDAAPTAPGDTGIAGSPTALSTQLPVSELLAPRGAGQFALVQHANRLTTVELNSGTARDAWSDPDRTIWAAAANVTGERIALLTAPNGSVSEWAVDFTQAMGDLEAHVAVGSQAGTPDHQQMQ